jgi:hypothetical protein
LEQTTFYTLGQILHIPFAIKGIKQVDETSKKREENDDPKPFLLLIPFVGEIQAKYLD